MMSIFKIGLIYFSFNIVTLNAYPINDYKELECSAQDDKIIGRREKRAALSLAKHPEWPNSIIYYTIACSDFTSDHLLLIKNALNEFETKTCLKFIQINPGDPIKDFIMVKCLPDGGCKSELGYQGGSQDLNLQIHSDHGLVNGGCMTTRKIQHEFMHALGFRHEHNSPIREKYVKIVKENIAKGWEYYFDIDNQAEYEDYGCPYDYESVMQVDAYRHSGNNQTTIISLDAKYGPTILGKTKNISACDIKRIQNMYCV